MKTRANVVAAILGAALAVPHHVLAAPPVGLGASGQGGQFVPGEVLVKFRPGVALLDREIVVASQGHSLVGGLSQPGWSQVKLAAGQALEDALAAYRANPAVEHVQPNFIYRIAASPNDPQYGQLWALKNTGQTISSVVQGGGSLYATNNPGTAGSDINAEKAWDHITDCSSVVVAVLDSGVNHGHADLAANMWDGTPTYPAHGYDFVEGNDDPMDLNGHGTHVAGIIGAAGNNANGTTGLCWKASIMAVRVLDALGQGSTATVIQGLNFALSNGAKVVNMSLGGSASFDQLFSDAISAAQAADVVVVVAAGNEGKNNDSGTTPTYPCNFTHPNLVCVAALDQAYQLASFSNYGTSSVDVGAPGTNILSTWAGTTSVIADPLNSGWTSSTTTAGGWAYGVLSVGGVPMNFLLDPGSYPGGLYNNGTDDRVRKSFNLTGASAATLQFSAAVDVMAGDHVRLGYASTPVDPFAGTGTILLDVTNVATFPSLATLSFNVSGCIGATCTIGFQLQSDSSGSSLGAAVTGFRLSSLALNSTSYNTIRGTSMATPEVSGLATMLRAYNPQYTCVDVVASIKNGGRATVSLSGKTTTGKAIDAIRSLAYINAPTGLAATVQ